jgi:regulator of cell morphogenesis and NO signaling
LKQNGTTRLQEQKDNGDRQAGGRISPIQKGGQMRAKRARAVREVAVKPFQGEKGRRQDPRQSLPSLKRIRGLAQRGALQSRPSAGNLHTPDARHAETSTWAKKPLSSIVSHILGCHRLTYRRLRRLEALLAQVVDQYARDYPQLVELQVLFLALSDQLTTYMIREEQMLFPYILRLEEAAEQGERLARPVFGSLRDPIDVLMVEHEGMKAALERIAATAGSHAVPREGSASWRALARGLRALEQDLHRHLEIEDTILFPRAVSLENSDRYQVEV